jgi:hypothetical protein
LLVGKIAGFVVGEKAGENQRRVERRAQLVAHVRQKFIFILVCLLEFAGLVDEHFRRARQFILLVFEHLCLLFQLRIGLFQFGLLRFEVATRFAQRTALFFQLLVADAQFFLLRLQFFGLPLCFFEQIFQAAAIFGRTHAHADHVAGPYQKRFLLWRHVARKTEFHRGLQAFVRGDRHDHDFARLALTHTRIHIEIRRRNIRYVQ